MKVSSALLLLFVGLLVLFSCIRRDPSHDGRQTSETAAGDTISKYDSLARRLMYSDSTSAYRYATQAVSMARKARLEEHLIRALNAKGLVMSAYQDDSSMTFFTEALRHTDTSGYKSERGNIFYNIGKIYFGLNDLSQARIMFDSAINAGLRYDRPQTVCISLIAMASIHIATDDAVMAHLMDDSAYVLASRHGLIREKGVALGNLAQYEKNPVKATGLILRALQILQPVKGAEIERAQFLLNLGANQADPDSALRYYHAALDLTGQSRIDLPAIATYNNMAYAYLDKGDTENARRCILEKAIPLAKAINSYDWLSTLYDTYADVLIAQRSFDQAVQWLRKSTEARKKSDQMIAKRHVGMLNAMLDLNRKNLTILEQDREITRRNLRITRMTFWLALAGTILFGATVFFLWFRQRARNRLQALKLASAQKIIETGENEKEKYGMDLHDGIGALGIRINGSFDHYPGSPDGLRQEVDGHLEQFVAGMRTLSHRMNRKILERHDIGSLLDSLCDEYAGRGKMKLTYEIRLEGAALPPPVALHLFRIVQELLGNALKHAPGAGVRLTVTGDDDRLELEYLDDGPGFMPGDAMKKGMGLSNIFARVTLIGGEVSLEAEPGHGLYLKITTPAGIRQV